MSWSEWAATRLRELRDTDAWRETVVLDGEGPYRIHAGRPLISFASNDYLGLSTHARVKSAAIEAIQRFGTGAGASRLVTGTTSLHAELEDALARWQRCERALVFPTGYAANVAVLSVFGSADATVFSDELNHASIVDGCRSNRARRAIYRHVDCEHLEELLRATTGRKIVVSDLVFSMDGDVAPVKELAELCGRYDALLILDEAHAVLEPHYDLCCEVLRVGTLSKTLGAMGGWVAGTQALIELLVNRGRTFIFTTALSPADTAAALQALRIATSAEGDWLRAVLKERLREFQKDAAVERRSPIVPVIVGSSTAALRTARQLYDRGWYVPAIRPPTVPPGTSRLRIAFSALHSREMVTQLRSTLDALTCDPAPICS